MVWNAPQVWTFTRIVPLTRTCWLNWNQWLWTGRGFQLRTRKVTSSTLRKPTSTTPGTKIISLPAEIWLHMARLVPLCQLWAMFWNTIISGRVWSKECNGKHSLMSSASNTEMHSKTLAWERLQAQSYAASQFWANFTKLKLWIPAALAHVPRNHLKICLATHRTISNLERWAWTLWLELMSASFSKLNSVITAKTSTTGTDSTDLLSSGTPGRLILRNAQRATQICLLSNIKWKITEALIKKLLSLRLPVLMITRTLKCLCWWPAISTLKEKLMSTRLQLCLRKTVRVRWKISTTRNGWWRAVLKNGTPCCAVRCRTRHSWTSHPTWEVEAVPRNRRAYLRRISTRLLHEDKWDYKSKEEKIDEKRI